MKRRPLFARRRSSSALERKVAKAVAQSPGRPFDLLPAGPSIIVRALGVDILSEPGAVAVGRRFPRRARTTESRHGYPIALNTLARNFQAAAPSQVWLAELTYIPTGEGWLFLAAILDMHPRKIVGWSIRETLHTQIALDALTMAVERQRLAHGLINHSDWGIQYAAEAYCSALARSGITPPMSRKGDCWDNAPMESLFHTLKTERVHHRVYATRDQARRDLFQYIEGFYNPRRLHSALGYISSAEAERRAA